MTQKTVPSEALLELLSPDGYYTYLGISKPGSQVPSTSPSSSSNGSGSSSGSSSSGNSNAEHKPLSGSSTPGVDEDAVKKNYRKLSLKHHPDKPNGDSDTFRVLNRAQRVLMNPKLRQQYDVLGIDLDDDEDDDHHADNEDEKGEDAPSTAQGIVHEIAGMALTSIIQLGVRTLMMGAVAVLVVRYRWTLYPALAFLSYISYQMFKRSTLPGGAYTDMISPLMIAIGLICMYRGRTAEGGWTLLFWLGESLTIGTFTFNSASTLPKIPLVLVALGVFSVLAALWFRGNFWNYVIVIGLEVFMGIFVALAFPIMEMVLETILNEKLQKVGDKVRAHHRVVQAYYEQKLKQ